MKFSIFNFKFSNKTKAMDSCPPERQLNAVRLTSIMNKLYEGVHLASKTLFILVILLASGLFQRGQMASAYAESISLGIDPPIFQIQAVPPANIASPLTLENRGDLPLDIKIELKPFVPSDQENGQVKYVQEKEVNFADPLILQRVSITNEKGEVINNFKLDGKEKKNLTLAINLPKDSPNSDYYFSILFLASNNQTQSISSSQTISGIGANVLLSVGQSTVSGEISQFSSPVFLEKGPIPFTLRVKNKSNHFITPKGEILIRNIFGEPLGRVDLEEANILANSVRNFDASWPENILVGPYQATLSITLSDTGPLFRRTILFFVFPAKGLAAAAIALLILIYITARVKQRL